MSDDRVLTRLKEKFEEYSKQLTIAENDLEKSKKIVKKEFNVSSIKEAQALLDKLDKEIVTLEKDKKKLVEEIEEHLEKVEADE